MEKKSVNLYSNSLIQNYEHLRISEWNILRWFFNWWSLKHTLPSFFGAKEFTSLWYISKQYVWWRWDSLPTSLVKYLPATASLKSLWALNPVNVYILRYKMSCNCHLGWLLLLKIVSICKFKNTYPLPAITSLHGAGHVHNVHADLKHAGQWRTIFAPLVHCPHHRMQLPSNSGSLRTWSMAKCCRNLFSLMLSPVSQKFLNKIISFFK